MMKNAVKYEKNKNNWLCCNYVLIISLFTNNLFIKQTLNSKIYLLFEF